MFVYYFFPTHPPHMRFMMTHVTLGLVTSTHLVSSQRKQASRVLLLKANPKFKKETFHGERFNSLGFAINLTAPRKKSNVLIAQTLIRMLL